MESSPRTWGCFQFKGSAALWVKVFPTHVGVFLSVAVADVLDLGLPHARGGVSFIDDILRITPESSPRTWGCFLEVKIGDCVRRVFPTHVGVFLVEPPS